ncbi:MAG: hypothetical protein COB56_05065 [Robiginitomaculum sp.]|nr:MAG: hypothetical protein COB56_05065 [Robiginitomaculum sp.]
MVGLIKNRGIKMRLLTSFLLTTICASLSVSTLAGPKTERSVEIPVKDQIQPTENTASFKTGVPPKMPPNAKRSGYCCMLIDVNAEGEPENIRTSYCTDSNFKRPSIKASKKWKFSPAIKDGRPEKAYSQKFTNRFLLQNSRGQTVQDKEGIFVTRTGFNTNYEDLCGSKLIS